MASVLAHARKWPFSLDPLIAEATRRMRRRRLVVATLVVALAGGGAGAFFALRGAGPQPANRSGAARRRPPRSGAPDQIVVNGFGQSSRSVEAAGRPLDKTLAVFRSSRAAAALPPPSGQMRSLAFVAAHMVGQPGLLLPGEMRRVATAAGPIYLVPTAGGGVCLQAQRFETCHQGLLRAGITWNFESAGRGVDVAGIATDGVSGVAYTYGKIERRASLRDNVFFVHLPVAFPSVQLGRLTVSYRDGRPNASVSLG